jgi:hypothetical protein
VHNFTDQNSIVGLRQETAFWKIASFGKGFYMLCWLYYTNLYGHFFWRYIVKSDMDYNIRVRSNSLQFVESKEKEDEVELGD